MIDTLAEAQKLKRAGFSSEQAAAIVDIQWKRPSWVLHSLEQSGFERAQAEAVFDLYWSVRNDSLMRHPMRSGMLAGAVMSLSMFGLFAIASIIANWPHPIFH